MVFEHSIILLFIVPQVTAKADGKQNRERMGQRSVKSSGK